MWFLFENINLFDIFQEQLYNCCPYYTFLFFEVNSSQRIKKEGTD